MTDTSRQEKRTNAKKNTLKQAKNNKQLEDLSTANKKRPVPKNKQTNNKNKTKLGNVSETPTPTTCLKSTAVHLQFVRQYAPHLYRSTFLAPKLRRKGTLQYASHLYCSTPPICTAVRPPFVLQYFLKNTGGWGHRNVSEKLMKQWSTRKQLHVLKGNVIRKNKNGIDEW